tara:strand:- start:264 stop:2393 length:2130 start_codon:yes stop_codon:yes gene_type:complete
MVTLNTEQRKIIYHIKKGKNVVVDAVAGTGKTTVILSVAKRIPEKKVLQLTYNKSLKHEVREKIEKDKIKNIKVHTYHSLAYNYYSHKGHKDIEIHRVIEEDKKLLKEIENFDILIIDEAQDMTKLYFKLIVKFINDYGKKIQIVILGDYMQGLYEFKGSDVRFLTLGCEIWKESKMLQSNKFKFCTMKTSYRITNEMCKFINEVMIGKDRMIADRKGEKVSYIRNNRQNIEKIVYNEIKKLLNVGVKPNEIFILGGSIKGEKSNIRRLENMLVENNIPCHVPMLENENIDKRVINGKIVFSTFHSVKGRERSYVFIVGFDNNYFRFYGRDMNREICPNTLYVGCTRGSKELYVLEGDNFPGDRPLEFLQLSHLDMKKEEYINFRGMHQTYYKKIDENDFNQRVKITATDLIKFISVNVYEEISSILEKIVIIEHEAEEPIEIPSIIQTKNGNFEEVSDLNGIVITSIYYDMLKEIWDEDDKNILLELIDEKLIEMKGKNQIFLEQYLKKIPEKIETIEEYLYTANVNQAIQESLYFRLKQIEENEYKWLPEEVVQECKDRLKLTISTDSNDKKPLIEENIMHSSWEDEHLEIDELLKEEFMEIFRFTGRIDLITDTILWELKCTSEITTEHILQLIIYAWLYEMRPDYSEEKKKQYKLFNIKTGELIRIDATKEDLTNIIKILLKNRYQKENKKPDEEFIKTCREILK